MVSVITAQRVRWTGLPHSLKTNGDHLIWAITVRRPLKQQRERKVAPPGIKPRASGLSCQHSANELRHPPATTPLSSPFIALLLSDYWWDYVLIAVCNCWSWKDGEHNHSTGESNGRDSPTVWRPMEISFPLPFQRSSDRPGLSLIRWSS